MSQDNKKSFVMYQGDGSNNVFSVPMTKGKYGTISVAFVRRGLDQYEYNPDTWGLNGGLFAWDLSGTKVYTDTATPAIGATIYDQYGVDTGDTVTAVGGATITVNTNVYTRDALHDVDENTVLTWTGDTLQIGDYIVIERTTTRTQPFEFQNNQKHIEKSDDNLERQIQEVADKVDNALLVDPTHTIDSNKMNPVAWLETILRCVDKSVRALRYANGWLDYSFDDPNIADVSKTWHHLLNTTNVKDIHEVITTDPETLEEIRNLYYTDQDGATHKILLSVKMEELADVSINNLTAGQFLMFDGLHWKNVFSSATASWGTILGNLTDQTDLTDYISDGLSTKVSTDGSSTMTGVLKMRATSSFQCAIAPFWDGVGFYKLNSDDSVTLIASIETPDGFVPWVTNTYNIGSSLKKWKNLYLDGTAYITKINNGYDLLVPAKSGTLATKEEVDLAANSGRMITDQGVWYAKMYAATVAPAAEDGTNYADFSQVDSDNNPIIVIYTRTSGAWVQSETITPPAEYDGYVPITSKIWDIAEQAGQQGGRILWNHQSKEFTPYPQIISFEDIEVTGDSTVIMPQNPSASQIVNKDYVDNKFAGDTYHPDLFDWKWADHQLNDVQWLRADTFSWQSGAVYEAAYDHLVDDIDGKTLQSETIAGTTVQFYLADDGHKICPDTQESNVAAIYTATGVAWYYIIDTVNERFKLPRTKFGVTGLRDNVGDYIAPGLPNITAKAAFSYGTLWPTTFSGAFKSSGNVGTRAQGEKGTSPNSIELDASLSNSIYGNSTTVQPKATQMYLYFYVGNFTQSAVENTAGLNAELFNDKVDVGHEVIAFQRPTSANNYTWYRKYADGWVEMGGTGTTTSDTPYKVDLPVEMATQTSYQTFVQGQTATTGGTGWQVVPLQNTTYPKTSTSFYVQGSISGYNLLFYWRAEGMAA